MSHIIEQYAITNDSISLGNDALLKQHNQMNEISSITKKVLVAAHTLEEKSNSINAIVNTLSNIAKQTNLLALNAAIKCCH